MARRRNQLRAVSQALGDYRWQLCRYASALMQPPETGDAQAVGKSERLLHRSLAGLAAALRPYMPNPERFEADLRQQLRHVQGAFHELMLYDDWSPRERMKTSEPANWRGLKRHAGNFMNQAGALRGVEERLSLLAEVFDGGDGPRRRKRKRPRPKSDPRTRRQGEDSARSDEGKTESAKRLEEPTGAPPGELVVPPTNCGRINAALDGPSATHSADFTHVNWFGTHYIFDDGHQAKAVAYLWAEFENGNFGLSEKTIGEKIGSSSDNYRLIHTFRAKAKGKKGRPPGMHPAWETMIQKVMTGIYRLARPQIPK